MTRFTGVRYETEFKKLLQSHGYYVLNLGQNEAGDLIAFYNSHPIIFEIKSVKGNEFRFNRKTKEQWKKLKTDQQFAQVFYAVKFLKRGWKLYPVPKEPEPLRYEEGAPLDL